MKLREPQLWQDIPPPANEQPLRIDWIKILVAATCIMVIVMSIMLFLRWYNTPSYDNPPLIENEYIGPYKIIPTDTGGISIPHQDKLIYAQIAKNAEAKPIEEKIAPAPEQPLYPQSIYLLVEKKVDPAMLFANVEKIRQSGVLQGKQVFAQEIGDPENNPINRILVGPFQTMAEATDTCKQLIKAKIMGKDNTGCTVING